MIRTVIVDDEEDSRADLRDAISKYCPNLLLVGEFSDPSVAIEAIPGQQTDLVFLDVQMPHISGFEMLAKLLPVSFDVIFVSAYDRYAIKAIRFSAVDYLLKPVDIDDLIQAVGRIKNKTKSVYDSDLRSLVNNAGRVGAGIDRLAIPISEGMEVVETKDILFCEADDCYTILHMHDGRKKVVTRTLKDFEDVLGDSGFCRVHHSYLINLSHVSRYVRGEGGYVILSNGAHVDISRRKRDEFLSMLHHL